MNRKTVKVASNIQLSIKRANPSSMTAGDYAYLRRIFDQYSEQQFFPAEPAGLYQPVEYMMSIGGKRIRPVFVLMACDLFDGVLEKALPAAYGIELFHNYTLIHDDIMDHADQRRGKPTVHKTYGLNAGILSGDLTMVLSYQYILQSEMDPKIIGTFNVAARQICEGQQMDMDFEEEAIVNYPEYLEMIRLKTAVLLGVSLQIGASSGDASPDSQETMYRFGELLGVSFQLKDDWLDAFGNGEKIGKKVGGDILRNKKTGLIIKAWELANQEQRDRISFWFSQETDSQEKVDEILEIIESTGAKSFIEEEMESYYLNASSLLKELPVDDVKKKPLLGLSKALYEREA